MNNFQEYLPLVAGIHRRGPPRAIIHADFDRLDRRPIVKHDAEHFVPAAVARDAGDERLQLHVGDRSLFPFHLAADRLAFQRSIPARLELSEIRIFLYVDVGEPFDVGHSVPTGNQQAKREALAARLSGSPFNA